MPNPNPIKRPAKAPAKLKLPAGIDPWPRGGYRYRYTEGGKRQFLYGATPEECLRKRYEPKPAPALRIDEATTLAEYLRLWLKGLALRPNSIATHRLNVEHYLIPEFGEELLLGELSREAVKAALGSLRGREGRGGRPLGPRTVAHAYATLRLALNAAVDDGRLKYNPAARINPAGTTGTKARGKRVGLELTIPTELEVRRLRHALEGTELEVLFTLSALTGLRQSEALGLAWDGLEPGYVHVSQSLRRTDRTIDDPKNATSARWVPMPTVLANLLEVHRDRQRAAAIVAGDRWHNPAGLIFTTELGAPLVGSTVSHQFADACERAGLPRYRWHDLRHYYASLLINRGVSIAVVSKLLGHANVTITSEVYHHLIKADEAGTAAIAAQAFGG